METNWGWGVGEKGTKNPFKTTKPNQTNQIVIEISFGRINRKTKNNPEDLPQLLMSTPAEVGV